MAGAARPGPPDPRDVRDDRIPCPLCGGLLHPIAGKCKHCKADLTAYRTVRPAANAPLPALNQGGPIALNGHPVHAPTAYAAPMPPAAAPVQIGPLGHAATPAVLPPRPGTRMHTAQPAASAWRSWPIFVIVVAMMAIVAAVVLMMWPTHGHDRARTLKAPPAPERMDTQTPPVAPKIDAPATPPPAQGSADPWGMRAPDPGDPSAASGAPHGGATAPQASADPPEPDLDAIDPFNGPHGAPSRSGSTPTRRRLSLNHTGMVVRVMQAHLCRKLADCGAVDAQVRLTCGSFPAAPDAAISRCPAALRCVGQIDAMACTGRFDPAQLAQVLGQADCLDAMHC